MNQSEKDSISNSNYTELTSTPSHSENDDIDTIINFYETEVLDDFYHDRDEILYFAKSLDSSKVDSYLEADINSDLVKRSIDKTSTDFSQFKKVKSEMNLKHPHEENRLNNLINFPFLLQKTVNAGDEVKLKLLIEKYFTPDCTLKTNALPDEVVGRDHLTNFWNGILRAIPDFVMICKPPKLVSRVITVKVSSLGTHVIEDDAEKLFNHLKYNDQNTSNSDQSDYKTDPKVRNAYLDMVQRGTQISFRVKSVLHLVMNQEMTHFEKYVSKVKQETVFESRQLSNEL
jgi:hypothetical protein